MWLFLISIFAINHMALANDLAVGDPAHIKVPLIDLSSAPSEVQCHHKKIPFFKGKKFLHFFFAESYYSKNKEVACRVLGEKNSTLKELKFAISIPDFPKEKLKVKPGKVNLNAKDLMRAIKEKEIKAKLYDYPAETPYFINPFVAPLDAVTTSIYGTQRVFNKVKQSEHLGTDLRAPVGAKVVASNRGKVILSEDLFFEGKTVVIDHGLGIFTAYAHLSEFKVSVGDIVEQGQLIALSGDSGRVSGPHLHWGVKIQGEWVDAEKIKGLGGLEDEVESLP